MPWQVDGERSNIFLPDGDRQRDETPALGINVRILALVHSVLKARLIFDAGNDERLSSFYHAAQDSFAALIAYAIGRSRLRWP